MHRSPDLMVVCVNTTRWWRHKHDEISARQVDRVARLLESDLRVVVRPSRFGWMSLAAARADGHLADGETVVVEAARHHWQLVGGQESGVTTSTRRRAA